MSRPRLSIVGLGKLGAPMAACFAAADFEVVGVDVDERKTTAIAAGRAPVFEPGLQELLDRSTGRVRAGADLAAAVAETEVTFVVVATPSEPGGGFSLRYVLPVCEAIGEAIARKDGYHLVVLTSTVMPGSTGGPVQELLESASGKRCGEDFGLCYSPEFIALGSVIRDFLEPDFLLVGESDERAGDLLAAVYASVCRETPPVARMGFVNAELAKLAVNTYVTTKITFANTLAQMAERLPGGDVDAVTSALGLDSRIGPRYLRGAISYGGPCFPRDNLALAALARSLGTPARVAEATDHANREGLERLADAVRERLPAGGRVGLLGLAYKPETDVIDESPALLLAGHLADGGIPVVAYDPAAVQNARDRLGASVSFADSARSCIEEADVVVLATPWPEFAELGPDEFSGARARVVLDCWRMLQPGQLGPLVECVPLGRGHHSVGQERAGASV
jgi:UDPglucose 6-dehydrogenase